jgi:hypothetical protein
MLTPRDIKVLTLSRVGGIAGAINPMLFFVVCFAISDIASCTSD